MATVFFAAGIYGYHYAGYADFQNTSSWAAEGRTKHGASFEWLEEPSQVTWPGSLARDRIFPVAKNRKQSQAIRVASQKLEASQRTSTKLQAEITQQKVQWKKFQDKISEEYEAQLTKYQERIATLNDALQKAGEDYTEAKKILQEAANETEENTEITHPPDLPAAPAAPPGKTAEPVSKSPKRKTGQEEKDALAKRLRQDVHVVSDEELMSAGTDKGGPGSFR